MILRGNQKGICTWWIVACVCAVFAFCANAELSAETGGSEENRLKLGEKEEKFVSWLQKKGYQPEGVEIAYFPGM